jgi:hypothetical protein
VANAVDALAPAAEEERDAGVWCPCSAARESMGGISVRGQVGVDVARADNHAATGFKPGRATIPAQRQRTYVFWPVYSHSNVDTRYLPRSSSQQIKITFFGIRPEQPHS